jgi:hypothetical protein
MSAAQRYLTLATVVLGASLYGTALLTTSTILPQMQVRCRRPRTRSPGP